uniref:CDP-diacylglycerol--inositol 3-phosphatidyltransferase n=1 Tax=Leptobrachium leishanense TaxID=445787 RepID=A0A8C5QKC4_9ANUR
MTHEHSMTLFYDSSASGYARILFAFIAFYFMTSSPTMASTFYLLSGLLDAFDGHAARALNQGTKFGAMLDMLTDRCATMCLLVNLSLLYPAYTLLFQLSMSLDISSHWMHLHSSIMKGSDSHKSIDLSGNPVLRLYYTSRPVLFLMCAGNELFYCTLYLLHFAEGPAGQTVYVGGKWRPCEFIHEATVTDTGRNTLHMKTKSFQTHDPGTGGITRLAGADIKMTGFPYLQCRMNGKPVTWHIYHYHLMAMDFMRTPTRAAMTQLPSACKSRI